MTGNVFPSWENSDVVIRAEEQIPLEFGLVDAQGSPIKPGSLLGESSFQAVLVDANGEEKEIASLAGKEITGTHDLDTTGLQPGKATLRMSLGVTTAPWKNPETGKEVPGTELRPQVSEVPVTIGAPAGFPTIEGGVSFGPIEGKVENAPGTLRVTGPGCVWVDAGATPTVTTGPEEISAVSITSEHNSPESCLQVAEGESADLPVSLTSESGNGALNGTCLLYTSPSPRDS